MSGRSGGLGRDLVVYGLGEVAVRAFGFITLPIYTRLFAPADYGVYGYLATLIGLVAAVLILGGDSAYARFYFATSDPGERRSITTTWIGFLAAFSLVAVAVLAPLAPAIAQAAFDDPGRAPLVFVAIAVVPIQIVNRMLGQVLRNEFRALGFTVLNLASMALGVGASVVGVVVLGLGLGGIFLGALLAELVMLPIRAWAARDMLGLSVSRRRLRELLGYGLPLVPMSIAYWVFLTSDRIVLGQLSTFDELGLYTVAASVVAIPSVAISAVGQAWSPHVTRAYEAAPDEAARLVRMVATNVLAGFGLLAVGVTAFSPEVLTLLSTARYAGAAQAIAPLALAMVAQASTNVTALGMSLVKRTAYLAAIAWLAAVVNLVLNLVLDAPFGMLGAAWATAAAYTALTVGYLLVSQRLWPVPYDRRAAATAVIATVAFTLGATWLPNLGGMAGLALKAAWCGGFVVTMVALGVVDSAAVGRLLRRPRRPADPAQRAAD